MYSGKYYTVATPPHFDNHKSSIEDPIICKRKAMWDYYRYMLSVQPQKKKRKKKKRQNEEMLMHTIHMTN